MILLLFGSTVHSAKAPEWHQYRSGHVTLVTDLKPDRAQRLLQEVMNFDLVLDHYMEATQSSRKQPATMLVFSSRKQLYKLIRSRHYAAYTQPYLDRILLVVAPSPGGSGLLANTLHEYTHYKLRADIRSYPLWYEEGLAEVLSSTRLEIDGNRLLATVGKDTPDRPADEFYEQRITLGNLLSTRSYDQWSPRALRTVYRKSTQLVHFLLFGPEAGYPDYREALEAYFQERSADVFETLGVSEKKLSRALTRYSNRRTSGHAKHEQPAWQGEVTRTPVSTAGLNHYRAMAALVVDPKLATKYYRQVTQAVPDDPVLWVERAVAELNSQNPRAAQNSVKQALNLAPDHPAALIQQARNTASPCWGSQDPVCDQRWAAARQGVRRALEIDPQNLSGIYLLGVVELYTGNPGRAVNYLRVVHRQSPWSARLNYHYGECLRQLGNPRAAHYLSNARDWAQSPLFRRLAEHSIALLDAG